MRNKIFRIILILLICTGFMCYGILIGKYKVFPYSILKTIQDNTEEVDVNLLKDVNYNDEDKQALISVYPSSIDSIRVKLKNIVFGDFDLSSLRTKISKDIKDPIFEKIQNLKKIEKIDVHQKFNIRSVVYIFHPQTSNNRAVFYHQGHGGGFEIGKNTIAFFLKQGFTVYAFAMPLKGKNNRPIVKVPKIGQIQLSNHEEFKYFDHPLQYFLAPVVIMLDHAENQNFKDINMVGVSGGGWTTTLAAALDERIKSSYPVAGSFPMFVRYQESSKNYGDYEQTLPDLYTEVNYLDLYILGSVGKNRSQLQISNKYDPCCYGGDKYHQYDSFLKSHIESFENGSFEILSDSTHKEHKISDWALNKILENLMLDDYNWN